MSIQDQQREIMRQAGAVLRGNVVTMWELSRGSSATPVLSSVADPPQDAVRLDLDGTLKRWERPLIEGSRWVGTQLEGGRWCVAPVRVRPAAPPPDGTERRGVERLVLELTGLCLGALQSNGDGKRRLPPAEALLAHARQPSVIAHEVGNPLAVAQASIELVRDMVRRTGALEPRLRQGLLDDLGSAIDAIEEATGYLRSIQDQPFGPPDAPSRFDATPVLRSAVALERPLARRKGVALTLESSVDAVFLFGTPGALYQVVTNLIRNAVDASQARRTPVAVAVGRGTGTLRVAVRDQGSGIAPADLQRIFEPGFSKKARGSGMGLAVVREITRKMFGGMVTVDTRLGEGSTFTIDLPIPPQRRDEDIARG